MFQLLYAQANIFVISCMHIHTEHTAPHIVIIIIIIVINVTKWMIALIPHTSITCTKRNRSKMNWKTYLFHCSAVAYFASRIKALVCILVGTMYMLYIAHYITSHPNHTNTILKYFTFRMQCKYFILIHMELCVCVCARTCMRMCHWKIVIFFSQEREICTTFYSLFSVVTVCNDCCIFAFRMCIFWLILFGMRWFLHHPLWPIASPVNVNCIT